MGNKLLMKQYRIKDIATVNRASINKNFSFETINYIDIASVEKGLILEVNKIHIKDAPSRAKRIIQKNDIIYSTVRPNLQHYAFINNDIPINTIVSTGFATITANLSVVEPRFLYYKLTQPNITDYLSKIAEHSVSTYPTIASSDIENLNISLPPLSEQKRISNILSSFDNKIEILKKENKILEDIAENIFKEWFVKYNFPNKYGKPYRDSNGKMIDSELGPIPEGWRVGKLGETIECFDSQRVPLPNEERAKRKGQYPYYGATEIMDYINDYIFDGKYLLLAEDGSVQTERGYPILQLVKGQFWANNHTHVLQGKGSVSTEYLYLLMTRFNITSIITGAVQPKINQRNLLNLDIVIPTENLLKTFEEMSSSAFEKIFINNYNIANLDKIKTALLNKLITA